MCIDDERIPILDWVVLVLSPHENHISDIHIGASKHYTTHIKRYYV
jgi:hypothetical protein